MNDGVDNVILFWHSWTRYNANKLIQRQHKAVYADRLQEKNTYIRFGQVHTWSQNFSPLNILSPPPPALKDRLRTIHHIREVGIKVLVDGVSLRDTSCGDGATTAPRALVVLAPWENGSECVRL